MLTVLTPDAIHWRSTRSDCTSALRRDLLKKQQKSTINCIQVAGVGAGVDDKMFNRSRNKKNRNLLLLKRGNSGKKNY